MPIPNIALFVRGRKWHNSYDQGAWVSNDGWQITYKDLRMLSRNEQLRLTNMLEEHALANELTNMESDNGDPDF